MTVWICLTHIIKDIDTFYDKVLERMRKEGIILWQLNI